MPRRGPPGSPRSPARLVFIDETGTTTNMARLRGRAKRGQRVVGRVPWGHWKVLTFVAGLRRGGITAPFVIDRAMTPAPDFKAAATLAESTETSITCPFHTAWPLCSHLGRPHSNALRAASFNNSESRLDGRKRHVVGHYGLSETLKGECAKLFGCDAAP